jgi:hypothetical protein
MRSDALNPAPELLACDQLPWLLGFRPTGMVSRWWLMALPALLGMAGIRHETRDDAKNRLRAMQSSINGNGFALVTTRSGVLSIQRGLPFALHDVGEGRRHQGSGGTTNSGGPALQG